MIEKGNSRTVVNAPRRPVVFFLQLLSATPLITAVVFIVAFFIAVPDARAQDILILSSPFTVPLFVLALVLYYLPSTYIANYSFDRKARLLTRVKKGDEPQVFNLKAAKVIVSRRTFTNPGLKYEIIVQDSQGGSQVVFDENPTYWRIHWTGFSEKLSEITGLPLKQEQWVEDMNGKLSLIPKEKIAKDRRRNLIPALIALGCALACAVLFRVHPTPRALLYFGIATVALNTSLSIAYAILNKKRMGELSTSYFVLIVSSLAQFIPYSVLYLVFAFSLNGFRLPTGQ